MKILLTLVVIFASIAFTSFITALVVDDREGKRGDGRGEKIFLRVTVPFVAITALMIPVLLVGEIWEWS